MPEICVDVWLYGELARFGGDPNQKNFANIKITLPEGGTISDILKALQMATEDRGITFINGNLSAMPGMQPDLDHLLKNGDRVAFFHLRSMWPFQYRHGVAMIPEMQQTMLEDKDQGLHHTYTQE